MGDKARAACAEAIEPGRKLGCRAISIAGRIEFDEDRGGIEIGHLQVVYGERACGKQAGRANSRWVRMRAIGCTGSAGRCRAFTIGPQRNARRSSMDGHIQRRRQQHMGASATFRKLARGRLHRTHRDATRCRWGGT